jgi:hypothetical protein
MLHIDHMVNKRLRAVSFRHKKVSRVQREPGPAIRLL